MEPNTMAYLQYLTWSIDQLQTDAATAVDIDSLAAATATDVDMASLTDATETTMIGTLTGGSGEGCSDGDVITFRNEAWRCVPDLDTIQIVDDPGDSVILTIEDSNAWIVTSDRTYEWSNPTVNIGDLEIGDFNCSAGQFVTVKDHKMVCVTPSDRVLQTNITKEVQMWTVSNIVIVAIVAAIVFKLMPKLTLRNFFKAVWKLVIRPFKRKEQAISDEWSKAEFETRDK